MLDQFDSVYMVRSVAGMLSAPSYQPIMGELCCSLVGAVSLLLRQLRVIGIDAATPAHGDHCARQARVICL